MKADDKNTGKSVMYKKLKNYYDNDVDNIVSSVIQTCMTDKNSMACQIFTSKIYEFNSAEKHYFVIIQNPNKELEFSKSGISLAANRSYSNTEIKKADETDSEKISESAKETELTEVKQINKNNLNNAQQEIKIEDKNANGTLDNSSLEISANKEASSDSTIKNTVLTKNQSDVIFKSILTTGEENNIDYIKNKIYSFDISYKEPANTKIRWLVSFDGKSTWKKWDGNSWVLADTTVGLEKYQFFHYWEIIQKKL